LCFKNLKRPHIVAQYVVFFGEIKAINAIAVESAQKCTKWGGLKNKISVKTIDF
jgi:hypothetical protein